MGAKRKISQALKVATLKTLAYFLPTLALFLIFSVRNLPGGHPNGQAAGLWIGGALKCLLFIHLLACLPLFALYFHEKKQLSKADSRCNSSAAPAAAGGLAAGTEKEDLLRSFLQPVCALVGGVFFYFIGSRLQILSPLTCLLIFTVGLFVGFLLLLNLNIEVLLYLLFGALTAAVSIGSFSLVNWLLESYFPHISGLEAVWLIPQSLSFLAAVLFAFFTNRKWVFRSKGHPLKEFFAFLLNRFLSSLIFEYGGLYLLVNIFGMRADPAKILTSFMVVLVNYFISKYFIFKVGKTGKNEAVF